MIHADDLRTLIIRPALQHIGLWSQAAENLLVGTWFVESSIGGRTHLKQVGGPAFGGFQIEPPTHQDTYQNFLRYPKQNALRDAVLSLVPPSGFDADGNVLDTQLIGNLLYAAAIARIKYYRAPAALPSAGDLPALARYYKDHYNTAAGKATPMKFIDTYPGGPL